MEIEGKIWKDGKFWLVEIPTLDAMTQGKTRKEALFMAKDLVFEMMQSYFSNEVEKNFTVTVTDYKKDILGISSNDNKLLLALSLRRQREQSGSTVREVAERLGSKFPNAYSQYEQGRTKISLEKYEQLLQAANPFKRSLLRVI